MSILLKFVSVSYILVENDPKPSSLPSIYICLLRQRMPNITSSYLILCPFNVVTAQFLLYILHHYNPKIQQQQVALLDLDVDGNLQLPLVYLTTLVLSQVCKLIKERRPCNLESIRAVLEAGVNIIRKVGIREQRGNSTVSLK